MSTSSVSNLSSFYLQPALASALQSTPAAAKTTSTSSVDSSSSDLSRLSPFAQVVSTLQELQQTNPAKYADVTKQIAASLESAAQTAQSQGNSASASQFTELAGDFTKASQSGQLPDFTDLAQSIGGGGRHPHHQDSVEGRNVTAGSLGSSGSSITSSTNPTGNAASQILGQLVSLFQSSGSQTAPSAPPEPLAIILQTLADAGLNDSDN
jgi:hypothetical protein